MSENKNEGTHKDEGKLRLDLIPPEAEEAIARALGWAVGRKYSERNWESGLSWMRLFASVRRHLLAWSKREDNDPESGLNHMDHAMADIAMLRALIEREAGLDSRPSVGRKGER